MIDQQFWRGVRGLGLTVLAAAGLTACATPKPSLNIGRPMAGAMVSPSGKPLRGTEKPYQIKGIWYYPHEDPDYDAKGVGSWYGEQFHNRRTANGELFDMDAPSAAHKTLPLPSLVEVTNLDNGRKMVVRVNDRGPFIDDRLIDLSKAAAEQLGYRRQGVARVRVRYIGPAPKNAFDTRQYVEAPAPKPAATQLAFKADQPIVWPAEPPPVRVQLVPPRPDPKPVEVVQSSSLKPVPSADAGIAPKVASTPLALKTEPPIVRPAEPTLAPTPAQIAPSRPDVKPVEMAQSSPLSPVPSATGGVPKRGSTFRIQAGAFSNRENAERAVAQLKAAGSATIEPMERASGTLYRVTVSAGADESAAWSVREQVVALGYSGATVLRP